MKIEILTIGHELLAGYTLNTNALFLGKELRELGLEVTRQTVLPDNAAILQEEIRKALNRSDLVITTGGLGPTSDDITRDVAAGLYSSELVLDEDIANDLKIRFGEDFPTIQNQATIPSEATPLKNTVGTAPGLIFENQSTLILLPGIPVEMRAMFIKYVKPYIEKHYTREPKYYSKSLYFITAPEHVFDPFIRKMEVRYPNVEFGIYPAHGAITIRMTAANETQLKEPTQDFLKEFSEYHFTSSNGHIEDAIHEKFIRKGWTLSIAESCTGGHVAAKLTNLPGASQYFLGSIVSYSNVLKQNILGASETTLKEKGAVSEETVSEMAEGALKITESDYSIAVSGIAGPSGGSLEKPVGTVWCAIGQKNGPTHTWKLSIPGNREAIINLSANLLLGELLLRTPA